MDRYAVIDTRMPREFVLLQGRGCKWAKCSFCDYYKDRDSDPFSTNREVLRKVTGKYGVLDVINSGSAPELDERSLEMIAEVIRDKQIHTVWFEAHYMYRHRLSAFAARFTPATVKFRCGIESFDPEQRRIWNKGIAKDVTPEDVAEYFQGVCLLCCTQGETRERILKDISIAQRHFEYFSVNLFCNNSTDVKRDGDLARWFEQEIYPTLKDDPHVEVLLNNTDLGVG